MNFINIIFIKIIVEIKTALRPEDWAPGLDWTGQNKNSID